jgi:hypothetical protein
MMILLLHSFHGEIWTIRFFRIDIVKLFFMENLMVQRQANIYLFY